MTLINKDQLIGNNHKLHFKLLLNGGFGTAFLMIYLLLQLLSRQTTICLLM